MAAKNQNGGKNVTRPGEYLCRYFTNNDNFFSVYYISKTKEFNPDIIFNFGIQYGG